MKKKYFEELMKLADLEHHDIIDRSFLPSHAVIPKTSTMRSQGHDDWANNVILLAHENCPELSQYTNKKIIDNVVAANENPEINDEASKQFCLLLEKLLETAEDMEKKIATQIGGKSYSYHQVKQDQKVYDTVMKNMWKHYIGVSHSQSDDPIYAPDYAFADLFKLQFESFWKGISVKLQNGMKFSIEADSDDNHLSQKEIDALSVDVPLLLPYEKCVLECTDPEHGMLVYLLVEQREFEFNEIAQFENTSWSKDLREGIRFMMFVKDINKGLPWCTDHVWYDLQWLNRHTAIQGANPSTGDFNGYRYQLSDHQPIMDAMYIDRRGDDGEAYTNQSLKEWVHFANTSIFKWLALLHYPAICDQRKVKGLSPRNRRPVKNLKHSTLIKAPTWEHKILKLNMFKDDSSNAVDGTGKSKRFHAVRAHMRRLPTGKITWVKSHFRGDVSLGGITKDYEIPA